jgi:hypothetical protein
MKFVASLILFCYASFSSLTSSFLLPNVVSASRSTCLASSDTESNNNIMSVKPLFYQHRISITAPSRGCHLITSQIVKAIEKDLSGMEIGMANLFIQHSKSRDKWVDDTAIMLYRLFVSGFSQSNTNTVIFLLTPLIYLNTPRIIYSVRFPYNQRECRSRCPSGHGNSFE